MTEKEYATKRALEEVRDAESRCAEARQKLQQGIRKAQAEYETTVIGLKADLDRSEINLKKHQTWLELCRAEEARGFTT